MFLALLTYAIANNHANSVSYSAGAPSALVRSALQEKGPPIKVLGMTFSRTATVVTSVQESVLQRRDRYERSAVQWYLNAQVFQASPGVFIVTAQIVLPQGYEDGRIAIETHLLNDRRQAVDKQQTIIQMNPDVREQVLHDAILASQRPAYIQVTLKPARGVAKVREKPLIYDASLNPAIGECYMLRADPVTVIRLNDARCRDDKQRKRARAIDPLFVDNSTLVPAYIPYASHDGTATFLFQAKQVDLDPQLMSFSFSDGENSHPLRRSALAQREFFKGHALFEVILDVSQVLRPGLLTISYALPEDNGTMISRTPIALRPPVPAAKEQLNDLFLQACRASSGYFEIKHLVDCGADPTASDPDGNGALAYAVFNDRHKMIAPLVELGVPLDAQNKNGHSPIMVGAANGQLASVRELLKLKPDLTRSDFFGQTAMHHACRSSQERIGYVLIQAGSDLSLRNELGHTPLMEAIAHAKLEFIKLFELGSVDQTMQNRQGYGLAHLAILNRYFDKKFIRYLSDAGISFEQENQGGRTPLMLACSLGLQDAVSPLLTLEHDLERKDHSGETALMMASINGSEPVIRKLLKAGADPNTSNRGINALMLAANNGHLESTKLLLTVTNLDSRDERGWGAAEYAKQNGQDKLIQLFKNK